MILAEYKKLNNSISSFELIKETSEQYWEEINLDISYGFQVQQSSKWKQGLTEPQINDFEKKLGIRFPESLKNYYRTMNGLDKPGLNNGGGSEFEYGPTFYSYPEDIPIIKSEIEWVLDKNHIKKEDVNNVPSIFPYLGHRFLILDNDEFVLSMYGADIIFWSEKLSKGIAREIFPYHDMEGLKKESTDSLWKTKALHLEKMNNKML